MSRYISQLNESSSYNYINILKENFPIEFKNGDVFGMGEQRIRGIEEIKEKQEKEKTLKRNLKLKGVLDEYMIKSCLKHKELEYK
jgi:hypothetical protein